MSAVLIVDDSPADRALLRAILTRVGYSVHELALGGKTVDLAREIRPHAIVLDVNLADTNGHAICRALKADPEARGIPVLMLTVRDNDAHSGRQFAGFSSPALSLFCSSSSISCGGYGPTTTLSGAPAV